MMYTPVTSHARSLAAENALRLDHLADELERDRDKTEHNGLAWIEVTERIARHREEAKACAATVAAFDAKQAINLTPGERDSFIGGRQ